MSKSEDRCRLYLVSPPRLDDVKAFAEKLETALQGGDAASFQLRLKEAGDREILKAAEAILPVCEKFDVALFINDRADLARDAGADGVHLGQMDGSVKEAREILGFEAIIGVTCHNSRHLAFLAGEAGADYVAFGSFFPTETKETEFVAKPDLLSWWAELAEIPSVAIGGITVENCKPLIQAGANFLAVSSGVWEYKKGPDAALADFNRIMEMESPDNA